MPAATETDIIGALVVRVASFTPVTDLTGSRISAVLQSSWNMPTYAVLINGPLGGQGDLGSSLTHERFDLWCYGPDARTAKVLADRLMFNLLRADRAASVGFTAAGTHVLTIEEAGGRIAQEDPVTNWNYVVCQIYAMYSRVPV